MYVFFWAIIKFSSTVTFFLSEYFCDSYNVEKPKFPPRFMSNLLMNKPFVVIFKKIHPLHQYLLKTCFITSEVLTSEGHLHTDNNQDHNDLTLINLKIFHDA